MKWLDLSINERQGALDTIAKQLEIDTPSVEKDWWVTAVLRALFQTSFAPYLLFKGGTSLSKGWRLINRFSEDIDISLGREWFAKQGHAFAAGENKSQRDRLRKMSRQVVHTQLADELKEQLEALGITSFEVVPVTTQISKGVAVPIDSDKDPTVLQVRYNTIIEGYQPDYIQPVVKIEVSCLSLKEPFEPRPISSLLHETFANLDEDYRIRKCIRHFDGLLNGDGGDVAFRGPLTREELKKVRSDRRKREWQKELDEANATQFNDSRTRIY